MVHHAFVGAARDFGARSVRERGVVSRVVRVAIRTRHARIVDDVMVHRTQNGVTHRVSTGRIVSRLVFRARRTLDAIVIYDVFMNIAQDGVALRVASRRVIPGIIHAPGTTRDTRVIRHTLVCHAQHRFAHSVGTRGLVAKRVVRPGGTRHALMILHAFAPLTHRARRRLIVPAPISAPTPHKVRLTVEDSILEDFRAPHPATLRVVHDKPLRTLRPVHRHRARRGVRRTSIPIAKRARFRTPHIQLRLVFCD